MRTRWFYDERGQLTELVHEDSHGILDRYQYEYDLMGNKTAIIKERRGLKEESGRYEYGYDALSRLASVSKDGDALRSYGYDSFGNRSQLKDFKKGRGTFYHYDALNRLMFTEEGELEYVLAEADSSVRQEEFFRTDYAYDNRGNLIGEETGGKLVHGYEYGAMNRLSRAWNDKGQEAFYFYNGLLQRTGKSVNGEEEDYLLDLTRGYHNLLGIQKNESGQRFYFDGNVTAMEETGGRTAGLRGKSASERTAFPVLHYYLQDELGSPLRVSRFRAREGSFIGRSEYLTYGYDEFGNELGRELDKEGIPSPYDEQGVEQPFGYTGYRYDKISGTYFAQAREYQPENGRFTAEDVIKGNGAVPWTLNQYGYCWNNPLTYIDLDGKSVAVAVLVVAGLTLLLTGCGKELDEADIQPVPSATSDHEFKNSMEVYNSKEYIKRTNCYAYALDVVNNPVTGEELLKIPLGTGTWGLQPGMLSGQNSEYNSYVITIGSDYGNAKLIELVEKDLNAIGLKIEKYEEGMTGGYCIAIAVRDEADYHFYRENEDGTWSCKRGAKIVESGIENPQVDAYENKYKTFLGYFYISSKEEYGIDKKDY